MREITLKEIVTVSGADMGSAQLMRLWNNALASSSLGLRDYDNISQSINEQGFATATEQKAWDNSKAGEAGWLINCFGNKVTWFNNGVAMAFKIEA